MTLPRLTRSERTVLDFIRDYINLHGISPTYEEIARGLGKRSKSPIHRLVGSLIAKRAIAQSTNGFGRGMKCGLSVVATAGHEVILPDDLDAFVRDVASSAGVSPAAVIVEAVRDAAFANRIKFVRREILAPASVTVTPPTGAALEAAE